MSKTIELPASVVLYNIMALVNHCQAIELGISSLLNGSTSTKWLRRLERYSDIDASELVLLAPLHNTAQDLRVSMVQEVCV
jgi:hypothetical protein